MQDAVTSSSSQQGTGSFDSEHEDSSMMHRVGQAAMVLSGVALVALAARQGRSWSTVASAPIETAVTINRPRAELYGFWRRLENLPRFMKNLEEVTDLGNGRSHWIGKSPLGFKAEWDAEIVEEREGELLSWRSLPGSQIDNSGTVRFEDAPAGRGTVVRVALEFRGSGVGQAIGKALSSVTGQQVREDLRRFKQLLEAGELPTTEGQPHGTRSLLGHLHNPI